METFLILIIIIVILIVIANSIHKKKIKLTPEQIKQAQIDNQLRIADLKAANEKVRLKNLSDYINQFPAEKNLYLEKEFKVTLIKGITYNNEDGSDRERICQKSKKGDELLFIPDIYNAYDSNAIKVCNLYKEQLGFLDKTLAKTVKKNFDLGIRYKCEFMEFYTDVNTYRVEAKIIYWKYTHKNPDEPKRKYIKKSDKNKDANLD